MDTELYHRTENDKLKKSRIVAECLYSEIKERNAYTQCKCVIHVSSFFFFFVYVCHFCMVNSPSLRSVLRLLFVVINDVVSFVLFSFICLSCPFQISKKSPHRRPNTEFMCGCVWVLVQWDTYMLSTEWNVSSVSVSATKTFLFPASMIEIMNTLIAHHSWSCRYNIYIASQPSQLSPTAFCFKPSIQFLFRRSKNKKE